MVRAPGSGSGAGVVSRLRGNDGKRPIALGNNNSMSMMVAADGNPIGS